MNLEKTIIEQLAEEDVPICPVCGVRRIVVYWKGGSKVVCNCNAEDALLPPIQYQGYGM